MILIRVIRDLHIGCHRDFETVFSLSHKSTAGENEEKTHSEIIYTDNSKFIITENSKLRNISFNCHPAFSAF